MSGEYFGELWAAGVCESGVQVQTPVGELCGWCRVPVEAGDQGQIQLVGGLNGTYSVPMHRECHMRMGTGNVAHMEGRCYCRTGVPETKPTTPEEMRQEAMELWKWMEGRRLVDADE